MEDKLFDVSGRIVIITGGLGLIGSELVKAFHTRGAKVAVFSLLHDGRQSCNGWRLDSLVVI